MSTYRVYILVTKESHHILEDTTIAKLLRKETVSYDEALEAKGKLITKLEQAWIELTKAIHPDMHLEYKIQITIGN